MRVVDGRRVVPVDDDAPETTTETTTETGGVAVASAKEEDGVEAGACVHSHDTCSLDLRLNLRYLCVLCGQVLVGES